MDLRPAREVMGDAWSMRLARLLNKPSVEARIRDVPPVECEHGSHTPGELLAILLRALVVEAAQLHAARKVRWLLPRAERARLALADADEAFGAVAPGFRESLKASLDMLDPLRRVDQKRKTGRPKEEWKAKARRWLTGLGLTSRKDQKTVIDAIDRAAATVFEDAMIRLRFESMPSS